MARLNQWAFAGNLINSPNVRVGKIVGQFGLPPLRGANWIAQNATGEQFVPKLHGGRDIILPLIVRDTPNGISQGIFDMVAGWAATRTQSTLANILDTGTRTGMAECTGWTQTDMTSAGLTFAGLLTFHLADPWLYGPTVATTVNISTSTPTMGAFVSSQTITGYRTSYALSVSVVSGQPIVVIHDDISSGADATSITDTFSGHYTWTKIIAGSLPRTNSVWIGTGGSGTSGTVTVNFASTYAGGIAIPLAGCSTATGAGAIDASGAALSTGSPPFASLSLTPTAATEIAVYAVDEGGSTDIPGWLPAGSATYNTMVRLRANVLYAPPSGVPLVGTWANSGSSAWGAVGVIVKAGAGSSPTTASVSNPGTVVSENAILDFLGPITNPKVVNATTGTMCMYTGSVAAGQHLVINCGAFTALNNGYNAIGSVAHSGAVSFLPIAPGVNALTVYGSTAGGASLTVSLQPGFV